ncbi:XdhC family protein [Thalassotalea mangrovi]|uniref:XdhC family protein n=1 Tax=Thalassotalea mangrovi TaxID=2572245 RepID=A0A4U1B968_9GAMM|nr:XdhC family protein [Thalassotalea mangrovi]TKB46601.1 hypothetical protein E8M12_03335 [Thalassotalea mangrovi]
MKETLSAIQLAHQAEQLIAQGVDFCWATVVQVTPPSSASVGCKALVTAQGDMYGWIGGGCVQGAVRKASRDCLKSQQSRLLDIGEQIHQQLPGVSAFPQTCHSEGKVQVFIDPFIALPQLLVLGHSPVAKALVTLGQASGFEVYASASAIADTTHNKVQQIDPEQLSDYSHWRQPYIVVASQGYADEAQLGYGLSIEHQYLAFIASPKKAEKVKARIAAKLDDIGTKRLSQLKAPAGLDIKAITPEQIAISILAEIILRLNHQRIRAQHPEKQQHTNAVVASKGCCSGKANP